MTDPAYLLQRAPVVKPPPDPKTVDITEPCQVCGTFIQWSGRVSEGTGTTYVPDQCPTCEGAAR